MKVDQENTLSSVSQKLTEHEVLSVAGLSLSFQVAGSFLKVDAFGTRGLFLKRSQKGLPTQKAIAKFRNLVITELFNSMI